VLTAPATEHLSREGPIIARVHIPCQPRIPTIERDGDEHSYMALGAVLSLLWAHRSRTGPQAAR
jgi:hypothetical protein